MARLCVLMSVFAFGLSFAPGVLNGASGSATVPTDDTPTLSNAARFNACAADCRNCATDARLNHADDCARLCEKCEQFCAVCADPSTADCAAIKTIAGQHLTACVKSCQNSDREACKKCVASCLKCLELCTTAN